MKRGIALIALSVLGLALLAVGCGTHTAAAQTPTVQGSWNITPQTPGPAFRALAAFAAGGVFITTGSDQAGTGIGQWRSQGTDGFAFSYQNFHFDTAGALSSITTVNAAGTFQADTIQGNATQSVAGPQGQVLVAPQTATFTGTRFAIVAP
ncbi:MAG: hypothetical protein HYU66_14690 [Armatimonadetes bacterium]|nr:hypothetical protein [Armatimonadota bacterium]